MKTIRTNCFETNSSSTHAFSISAPCNIAALKPCQTFIADEEGKIHICFSGNGENSMASKLGFLLKYAYTIGDQSMFDRIKKVVESFTKSTLVVSGRVWQDREWKNLEVTSVEAEEDPDGAVEDEFCSWVGDHGNGSVEDFRSAVEAWVKDDQSILVFVFSNVMPFSTEEYYDG